MAVGISLDKTFTSVAAAMICKLLTEKVVMGLPLSILQNIILKCRLIWCRMTITVLLVNSRRDICYKD